MLQIINDWLKAIGHPPIPNYLTVETIDGKVVFVGASGNTYVCWLITPRLLGLSLDYAISDEKELQ